MAYDGKFTDRSPLLKAAGFSPVKEDEKIAESFIHEVCEDEALQSICKTGPSTYKQIPPRIDHYRGFYSDMRECLQPDLHGDLCDIQVPMMSAHEKVHGKPTPRDGTVAEVLSPDTQRTADPEQTMAFHHMYKKTHNDYDPGEQVYRNYTTPYEKNLIWGKQTPCDPQGGCVKQVMRAVNDEGVLVSKILSEHRKRTKPRVGTVHAPNDNIKCRPACQVFGKSTKRGSFGVRESLTDCDPCLDKQDFFEELSHINTLRNQIAKRQPAFRHEQLVETLRRMDPNNMDRLHINTTLDILADFQIYPQRDLFEALLKRLKLLSCDGLVNYLNMADILNVHAAFPDVTKLEDVPSDMLCFETTNQSAQKYHSSENLDKTTIPTAGLPPREHVSIESVVSPCIFTNYGLDPLNFFVPRSQAFLRALFKSHQLDDNKFQQIFNSAKGKNGNVNVCSFLKVYESSK